MEISRFKSEVIRRLGLNNGKLNESDFVELTAALIGDLQNSSGSKPTLDDEDTAELKLVFGPRRELQLARINAILEKHDVTLDEDTKGTIDLMLNSGVFLHQMSQIHDADGKPLVLKEVKTKKKDKMKSLFGAVPPVTPVQEDAEAAQDEGGGEQEVTVEKATPPPAPAKPAATKPAPKK